MINLDGNVDSFNPTPKQPDAIRQAPGHDRDEQFQQQLRRINDYKTAALTNPSNIEAMIGGETANMMEFQARLAKSMLNTGDDSGLTLDTLPAHARTLDSYLRLARAAFQNSQLLLQWAGTCAPARRNRPR